MTLGELNSNFLYVTDKDMYGVNEDWSKLALGSDGKYRGDCESYAMTVKEEVKVYNEHDFRDWDYYWCRINGVGHCVLCNGSSVIDNNVKRVVSLEYYSTVFTVTEFKKFTWFQRAVKMYLTYVANPLLKLFKAGFR